MTTNPEELAREIAERLIDQAMNLSDMRHKKTISKEEMIPVILTVITPLCKEITRLEKVCIEWSESHAKSLLENKRLCKENEELKCVVESTHGVQLIANERHKQLSKWTLGHDTDHIREELAIAAIELASLNTEIDVKQFGFSDYDDWGLVQKYRGERIKQLVVAGALIAAEIDRLKGLP